MAASIGTRPAPSRKRRAGNIIGITLCLILGPGLGTVLIVGSVSVHGGAALARSSYTQAHGVRRAARVISENTAGTGKGATSTVAVRLSGPVNGHNTTTVHIQGAPTYTPGAPVTVVVDPQDPGYAELPGAPYTSSGDWQVPLVIGLADILVFPLIFGVTALRQRRSRRRLSRSLLR